MSEMSLAKELLRLVRQHLELAKSKHFPPELYATWNYLSGRNRVCHPRTTALLAHAAWMLPTAPAVELEYSLVVGHGPQKAIKWQPDMVLRDGDGKTPLDVGKPLLFVDFESPNSSDFRVIDRDIMLWDLNCKAYGSDLTEYLIITSLPNYAERAWKSRYTKADGYEPEEARKDPFRYWYEIYQYHYQNGKYPAKFKGKLNGKWKGNWKQYPTKFANFDGNKLKLVELGGNELKLVELDGI